jgi:hypothetical protein
MAAVRSVVATACENRDKDNAAIERLACARLGLAGED